MNNVGISASSFGFTGEWTNVTNLVYLRAKCYAPIQSRFTNRDIWSGDYFISMSDNRWLYVLDNPINYKDPSGLYSDSIIKSNLQGKTLFDSFGIENLGVPRWGLYALLRDAKDFDQITTRFVDFRFSQTQKYYPLNADNDDLWNVHFDCDRLIFSNGQGVGISLLDFLSTIENKAEYKSKTSDRWWRPATLKYHWYDLNGRFYSDFYKGSHMPAVLVVGGSYGVFGKGSFLDIHDRYGNEYETLSLGLILGGSIFEVWEGYASLYNPNSGFSSEIPSEQSLRNIIEGLSAGASVSMGTVGIGKSWWQIGGITLVGDRNANIGAMVSISHTDYKSFNELQKWSWVDEDIPAYGPIYPQ